MKIKCLEIENFRGISRVELRELGDTVIIAGQNGSGKSCIFDAIRLLKSTYGGYHQNEWQNFFGEFAIQLHSGIEQLRGLFNDPTKNVRIYSEFVLRAEEKSYIQANAAELIEETIWRTILPEAFQFGGYHKALFANQFRERKSEVLARVEAETPHVLASLQEESIVAEVVVLLNGVVNIAEQKLLSVIFSNYLPRYIGLIDYHGAQRHYGRENVQGINLSLDQQKMNYSQHTLYNYNNKYSNVKSEMASSFVKELLAEKAGPSPNTAQESLTKTLQELFEAFFPDKRFVGPRPTPEGGLEFPVITQSGREHDLDELSSGEKEILYGYLRIRSSAPKNSIILLDEPELHLNPRLIRGLPEFYRKHLGQALSNQIWLVTHSDALIREAVGKPGFNVYHMLPCNAVPGSESQMRPLSVTEDLESALADLVGDLAAYRPGGKGLIFEGGGDTDFDKHMAWSLFPVELRGINLISGSNKIRVRLLHEVLARAWSAGDLPTKFYAITDADSEESIEKRGVHVFEWDVYHIENYLLEPPIISDVIKAVSGGLAIPADVVQQELEQSARKVVPALLIHKLRTRLNSEIVSKIDLGFSPNTDNISQDLYTAVERSVARLSGHFEANLTFENLLQWEQQEKAKLEACFTSGTWNAKLPGREILKVFMRQRNIKISYEVFRNLIVARMAEVNCKPLGMSKVIDQIRAD